MNNSKQTPLHEEHLKLGAKMVSFAGWDMPIQYSGIIEEHKCVRENAGIFDVSHMGEVFVYGKDSILFLQSIVPQNIKGLTVGKAVYSQLTNDNGGIIDDLIIYRLKDRENNPNFLLIINASRINEDIEWIEKIRCENNFELKIENISGDYSLIAVQGPKSSDIINDLGLDYNNQPEYFSLTYYKFECDDVLISRTGYTGEDGFEILISNNKAACLWRTILEKGQKYGIKPIGLGARDTLRLEAALLLYGNDMNEQTTPVEASLGWSVPKNKEENYHGKSVIFSQFEKKPNKKLIGFKMLERAIPRHDYEIYKNNNKIGVVTSGGVSPTTGEYIGLGYINSDQESTSGSKIDIIIRNKLFSAEIVKRPFVPKSHPKLSKIQC